MHANASLFKAPEIKRAVQGGQAQIGEILLVNFENEDPLFGVDGVPFLATSYAESMKLYKASAQGARRQAREAGHDAALHGAVAAAGHLHEAARSNSAADMKGLKWRAYSPATSKIAELVGAQPVTVQAAELSQALATGVVDSYMSSGATGYDSKTYEHIKYFYDTQAWLPKNAVHRQQGRRSTRSTSRRRPRCSRPRADAETRGWKLSRGEERLVPRPAEEERHDDRRAAARS